MRKSCTTWMICKWNSRYHFHSHHIIDVSVYFEVVPSNVCSISPGPGLFVNSSRLQTHLRGVVASFNGADGVHYAHHDFPVSSTESFCSSPMGTVFPLKFVQISTDVSHGCERVRRWTNRTNPYQEDIFQILSAILTYIFFLVPNFRRFQFLNIKGISKKSWLWYSKTSVAFLSIGMKNWRITTTGTQEQRWSLHLVSFVMVAFIYEMKKKYLYLCLSHTIPQWPIADEILTKLIQLWVFMMDLVNMRSSSLEHLLLTMTPNHKHSHRREDIKN